MDKLTQAIIEVGLPQVYQNLMEIEQTLEQFPVKISESIDETVNTGVNKIIEASLLSQQHAEELQTQTTEKIAKDLQKAQIDFIISTKDSVDSLFNPQLEKLVEIVKNAESIKKGRSSTKTIAYMFLSMNIGCTGGVLATNYNIKIEIDEEKAKTEALYSAQLKTVEETLNENQQSKFKAEFEENFKNIYFK